MSYILEAIKKSDQQRQRGATPTLSAAQATVAAPEKSPLVHYGLFAAVLLGIGITIGWLHPWQEEQPAPVAEPVAANPTTPPQAAPAPFPGPIEKVRKTAPELPAQNPAPTAQAAPETSAAKPENPAVPEAAPQEPEALPFAGLPVSIQQEIPPMAIQLHAYSGNPGERLVSINSQILREGGFLTPYLKLEQITPDGMIFNYKGYRFRRGAR